MIDTMFLQENIGYWKAIGRKCIFVKSHEIERLDGNVVVACVIAIGCKH